MPAFSINYDISVRVKGSHCITGLNVSPLVFGDGSLKRSAWAGVLHFSFEPVWPGSRFAESTSRYRDSNGNCPCSESRVARAHPGPPQLFFLAREHVRGARVSLPV